MKSIVLPAFALLLILCPDLIGSEEDDVKAVFEKYKKAIQSDDGKTAAEVVDDTTIKWYADAIADALKADKASTRRMKLINKFTVLRLRLDFSKDELTKMTGKGLFILSIERGWTGKGGMESVVIDRVKFDKELAQAFLKEDPDVPAFYFIRSNNAWKLALWKSFEMANVAMSQMAKERGMGEDEFILATLKRLSKFKVDESLYEPPK